MLLRKMQETKYLFLTAEASYQWEYNRMIEQMKSLGHKVHEQRVNTI